jgi:hypothetical protein
MGNCSELCKASATPGRYCRCADCNGDNHGCNLDTDNIEIQNLRHGDINLLENKAQLGGRIEKVIDLLDGSKLTHSVCSEKAFRIGTHCLVLGRPHDDGHVQDEAGNKYWVYIICPTCEEEINLKKILQERRESP